MNAVHIVYIACIGNNSCGLILSALAMLLRWFRLYLVLYLRLSTFPIKPTETPMEKASSACEMFFWFRSCLTFSITNCSIGVSIVGIIKICANIYFFVILRTCL